MNLWHIQARNKTKSATPKLHFWGVIFKYKYTMKSTPLSLASPVLGEKKQPNLEPYWIADMNIYPMLELF